MSDYPNGVKQGALCLTRNIGIPHLENRFCTALERVDCAFGSGWRVDIPLPAQFEGQIIFGIRDGHLIPFTDPDADVGDTDASQSKNDEGHETKVRRRSRRADILRQGNEGQEKKEAETLEQA